jgi:hypothetical protein
MKARMMAGVLAVAMTVSFAFAQEVTPSINAGSKALLFTFSGLNTLGAPAYNGGLGAKYFLSPQLALRASLLCGYASQVVKTTLASGGKDGKNSGSSIGATIGAEYHLSFARVSPFVGGMLNFSTTGTTEELPINVANGPAVTMKNVHSVFGFNAGKAFSVGGIGGVELFILKELSLSAEYQLGYGFPMGYTEKTTTVNAGVTTDVTVDVIGYTRLGITNAGALTLAVYF